MAVDERLLGGIRVLVAVAAAGSFARAADGLGFTQSGVPVWITIARSSGLSDRPVGG